MGRYLFYGTIPAFLMRPMKGPAKVMNIIGRTLFESKLK